jgi:hypothetical protein
MEQRAKAEARRSDWLNRIVGADAGWSPHAYVGPIAAGEKVIAATESDLFRFIRSTYNDTLAVEMEGRGFLEATHANQQVAALIVRGISDLISNKSDIDDSVRQEVAARHASAFAFEILAKLEGGARSGVTDTDGHFMLSADDAPAVDSLRERVAESGRTMSPSSGLLKGLLLAAVTVLLVGAIGLNFWRGSGESVPPTPQPTTTATPDTRPERELTYWLTVRRKHDKEPFPSIGEKIFDAGSEFRVNVQTTQIGALYLFSEGRDDSGAVEWNTMFPTPANNNGSAWLQANPAQPLRTEGYVFGGRRGTIKLWLIWSKERIELLDDVVNSSFNTKGVIHEPERLQSFIKQYGTLRPEMTPDKEQFRVTLRGRGGILMDMRELEYQP